MLYNLERKGSIRIELSWLLGDNQMITVGNKVILGPISYLVFVTDAKDGADIIATAFAKWGVTDHSLSLVAHYVKHSVGMILEALYNQALDNLETFYTIQKLRTF